jgi:rubrerythrin
VHTKFNADEVLRIAEQIERNGTAFYERAADRFRGEERRTLLRLADMERSHQQVFATMRRELLDADKGLEAFEDPVALLGPEESIRRILEIAVDLEKDSVVFYVAFKAAVPESLGRGKIDEIIREEMDHVLLVSEMLSSLDP